MPPPTSTITARRLPRVISNWSPDGATASLSGVTFVGSHGDPGRPVVAEARPRPVDQRLGPVLARREQREVYRTPGQRRGFALHRATAPELDHRCAPADRRHRALVLVDERLRRFTGDEPRDVLACLLSRLHGDRAQLWQDL